MTPGPIDHCLAIAFGIAFPLVAFVLYERRRPGLVADVPGVRAREYLDTIAWLGGMGATTVAVWAIAARPWSALGIGAFAWGMPAIIGTSSVLLIGAFFVWQIRILQVDPRARASLKAQTSEVDEYLPRTPREGRLFHGVAVAAGVGEELFYRGFLPWYLATWLPPVAAVALAAALFASAHAMHGRSATLKAGVLGLFFSGLYEWTGALYVPMLLHTLIDWFAGAASLAARAAAAPEP